jgi:predicted dehydrogenase
MLKYRAGVVGLGRHGFRHIEALRKVDGVELSAVCDIRPEVVKSAIENYPGTRGYTDWSRMLQAEALDLLCIVTNGPSHAEIALAAASAGVKYIFCEKPFVTSIADARNVIQECNNRAVRLSVCHARRWVPGYQNLRAQLDQGVIGKICQINLSCGGGLFAGNGTHFMDLARMLSRSEPVSVTAFIDKTGTPNPRGASFLDPGALAIYWFENGMRLIIDMYEDLGTPPKLEILGSIGRVVIEDLTANWRLSARLGANRNKPTGEYWTPLEPMDLEGESLNMISMLAEGLKELLSDDAVTCTGEDGLAAVEMVLAAHVSDRLGNVPVRLPLLHEYHDFDLPVT